MISQRSFRDDYGVMIIHGFGSVIFVTYTSLQNLESNPKGLYTQRISDLRLGVSLELYYVVTLVIKQRYPLSISTKFVK